MLSELYGEDYYRMRQGNAAQRELAYRQEYERIAERVPGGLVLDIGCGTGDFLDYFPRDRWTRYGLEVSTYAIQKCKAKAIRMIDYHDLDYGSFDLVVFRGVLQHISDPFYSLRQAYRLLKDGGAIAILAQPDADSLCYKLFGELPALDLPRNWWIPGWKELKNVLTNIGFRNIDVTYPYRGGPYANPIRDFARFIMRLFGIRKPFAFPGNMLEAYAVK
jgi:SAM-dependent methyltransferase